MYNMYSMIYISNMFCISMTEKTSAALYQTTLDRLRAHGAMGDSIDDVLNKILDKVEKK